MAAPELRMGRDRRWTPASLRDNFRHKISELPLGVDRLQFAYGALSQMAKDGGWTKAQMRAIALGLELGMYEEPK